jgi:hypothetical protein
MIYNLLEMTQEILSSLGSDQVTSISDTAESDQVAHIIRTAYFNIITRANLPEHKKLFSLDASGSSLQPVLMLKPDTVGKIEWIKYNTRKSTDTEDFFNYVTILPVQQFVDRMHILGTDSSNVDTMTLNNETYYYTTDAAPLNCTLVQDYYIIFDSYDSVVDTSTLQANKTLCYGQKVPTFTLSDSFEPDLDETQFPLLLNEAKALAFLELKQVAHNLALKESKRQWNTLGKGKDLVSLSDFNKLPNYGRRK